MYDLPPRRWISLILVKLGPAHSSRARRRRGPAPFRGRPVSFFFFISYIIQHTTKAERKAEKSCRRRGASSGQKTKRGIEGEDPATAGIERFFSLKGPREENNGIFLFR